MGKEKVRSRAMPTQEERLTALEQATRESLVHMRDTDMAVTAMVGVVRSQGQDIKRMLETLEQHTELLQAIETSIQLLAGNITNMRTELLVIKALVQKEGEQPS